MGIQNPASVKYTKSCQGTKKHQKKSVRRNNVLVAPSDWDPFSKNSQSNFYRLKLKL